MSSNSGAYLGSYPSVVIILLRSLCLRNFNMMKVRNYACNYLRKVDTSCMFSSG